MHQLFSPSGALHGVLVYSLSNLPLNIVMSEERRKINDNSKRVALNCVKGKAKRARNSKTFETNMHSWKVEKGKVSLFWGQNNSWWGPCLYAYAYGKVECFKGQRVFIFELCRTEEGKELGSSNLTSLVHDSNSYGIRGPLFVQYVNRVFCVIITYAHVFLR